MSHDVLDIKASVRSRELDKRKRSGVRGLLKEIKDREPDINISITMKAYAAIECGRIIQSLREEASMTQRQLAQALGVSQQFISKTESGRAKNGVNVSMLFHVAEICNAKLNIDWSSNNIKSQDNVVLIASKGRDRLVSKYQRPKKTSC